jgi:type VI protein secretion system component VasK
MEPITEAKKKLGGVDVDILNGAGAGFCNSFGPITRKFPFTPGAKDEATLEEINGIFKPKDSKLSVLAGGVEKVIQCTGGECTVVDKAPVAVNPAFLRFFSQAVKFSRALYGDAGTQPNYHYTLTPLMSVQVDSFDITVNGDRSTLAGGTKKEFIWPGGANPNFKLNLTLSGGSPLGVQSFDGLWSVFRFFARANTKGVKGSTYDFQWTVTSGDPPAAVISPINNQPLIYEITFDANGAPAIFSKEFLAGMKCVPTVAVAK